MVDRLEKFLRRQNKKTANEVRDLIDRIIQKRLQGLSIKRLQTKSGMLYRVRKGRIRVIFEEMGGKLRVKKITYRDGQTYRNL